LDQVIQAVTGMNEQVSQLADQVAELQRRMQG
jgi:cell division septum initiation protein DivIVA